MKADRNRMNREMAANKAAAGVTYLHGRVDETVAAARLAEIPADTRNLTQRICGDPLPGRDARSKARNPVTRAHPNGYYALDKAVPMSLPYVSMIHGVLR